MPKKDTAAAVLGMLSTAGAETRAAAAEVSETAPAAAPEPTSSERVDPVLDARPTASVRHLPPAPVAATADAAPRTLRLQPAAAAQLRAA